MGHRTERSERTGAARAGPLVAAATAVAAAALFGCRTFQPAEPAGLEPGQTVRVELADSASRAAAGWTGPERDRVTGQVVRSSDDDMDLSIPSRVGGAAVSRYYRDTLHVPASLIRSVERQRISALRSAAVAGGVVAATALLFELDITGGGTAPPSDGGGPAEGIGIRIPLFP